MDQKLSVDHSWKAFFRLQAVLVPVWGLLNTFFVWRSFQYLPTHPTLTRAFLIGLTATFGISLVSVMFRAILGSKRNGSKLLPSKSPLADAELDARSP